MKTTFVLLVAACVLTSYLIDAQDADARKEARKAAKRAQKERENKIKARKLAKEMERRNEEAQETCMPLIMKMVDESEDVCRFRRWQLNEIMERGKNFSCFEDLKNTLFEKYENYTMMMSKYRRFKCSPPRMVIPPPKNLTFDIFVFYYSLFKLPKHRCTHIVYILNSQLSSNRTKGA